MESTEPKAPTLDRSQSTRSEFSSNQQLWLWLLLGALLLLGGGGFIAWRLLSGNASPAQTMQQPQGVPVKLQRLDESTIEVSSDYIGNLESEQGVELQPEASGRVTQIFVSSGDRVTQGMPIMELSADRTQADVNSAIANINIALAARNNADAQLRSLEADRIRAVAELELQETEYDRTAMLVNEGVRAERELDLVTRDLNTARATLGAADEQIVAAGASLAQAEATLAQAQSQADAAREDLANKIVVSPISGVVGDIPIKQGEYVNIGDTLTSITQNDLLELRFSVPIEQGQQLRVGLPVELRASEGSEMLAEGRVSFVSPSATAESQVLQAKAAFPNPGNRLISDQSVVARVVWNRRPGVLVPTVAVTRLGGQTFVYVAERQEQAEEGQPPLVARQRLVQLGDIQGDQYQVIEGVQPGEEIVVSGIINLSDGTPIIPDTGETPPGQMPPQ